ncbi:MAG: hypothetical protein KC912_20620 [Proteobacteria bacterium]|nr:hypothetical protein [Pseudomonadota bacterium]
MTRIALSFLALVAATGCLDPIEDCAAEGLCPAPFAHEQGRPSPFFDDTLVFADAGFEFVAESLHLDGLVLVGEVSHSIECSAPEVSVAIQTLTATLPATARATAEIFATDACVVVPGGAVQTSEVRVDLAPTFANLGCVGHLVLSVPAPETSSGQSDAVTLSMGDEGCEDVDLPALIVMPGE